MKERTIKYYKSKIVAEELIKAGIDYIAETQIYIYIDENNEEIKETDVYFKIKSNNNKEEITIHVNENTDNYYFYKTLTNIDKIRLWDFGFDSDEHYQIKEGIEYLKFALTNRIGVHGVEKNSKMNGCFYFDIKDMNKIDKFIEKLKEEYELFEINTFNTTL